MHTVFLAINVIPLDKDNIFRKYWDQKMHLFLAHIYTDVYFFLICCLFILVTLNIDLLNSFDVITYFSNKIFEILL